MATVGVYIVNYFATIRILVQVYEDFYSSVWGEALKHPQL